VGTLLNVAGFALLATARIGQAAAAQPPLVSCHVQPQSILAQSPDGIPQVSNLALLDLECLRSARRPMPASGVQRGILLDVKVYALAADGTRMLVPSSINQHGAGADVASESIYFSLDIPIGEAEKTAIAEAAIETFRKKPLTVPQELVPLLQIMSPPLLVPMIRQWRVGRFEVDVQLLDEGRALESTSFELEVISKGNFFDSLR
jgi:hypothetical protein